MRTCTRLLVALVVVAAVASPTSASAEDYDPIGGEGSSWAGGAIDAMTKNVKQFGLSVEYNPNGSTTGRKNFVRGITDFAGSDIPFQFQPEDGSAPDTPAPGSYAYMPITAGGTAFMYNLKINGQKVTNLRLSGENVTRIFTSVITKWNDPALVADNPGLAMPDRTIVPIVRSDGSGSTAQFTRWMINQHGGLWNEYCQRSGRAPKCGQTSFYPVVSGMIGASGDPGVAGRVAQSNAEGAIGYVNYSYAFNLQFPVAKVLNQAGYYNEPTPDNVAVSLLKAQVNQDQSSPEYLTQNLDGVYADTDERNYPLSSYSYLILPTTVQGRFSEKKGKSLGAFSYYAMCQAQEQSASLGYSPMPINLVKASFDQIRKIPGVVVQDIDIASCRNPTFSPDGTNLLTKNAKKPQDCDRKGPTQCATGTGGVKQVPTKLKAGAPGAGNGPAGSGPGSGRAGDAGGGGGATGGGPGPEGGPSAGEAVCDPETGVCTEASIDGSGDPGASGGSEEALSSPTTLVAQTGWSAAQTLLVLVALLTLTLVLAPAVVWRRMADREPS